MPIKGELKKMNITIEISCPTLCDPMDYTIHGMLQARILFPSPGEIPDPGIELGSPVLQADSLPAELLGIRS